MNDGLASIQTFRVPLALPVLFCQSPDNSALAEPLAPYPNPGRGLRAHALVLVIEDLSELIAAQRASAWQEVARRLAHEIKNPLTPIQLSAERIAKRFASTGHVENDVRERIEYIGAMGDGVVESASTTLR